jgi:magnesium chelatase family protein
MLKGPSSEKTLQALLKRDHTLHGGVLHGLDGYEIEIQARATAIGGDPSWRKAVKITGMPRGAVGESLDRICGAFAKLGIEAPQVDIIVNLVPPDLPKDGTWLDLPIAVILLQAAGMLPDLPESVEKSLLLVGELGLHGDIRRVPGVLSMASRAKPGQGLVVPDGNQRECALIMAKPGHEGCKICPVTSLAEVIEFFQGKRQLTNALTQKIELKEVPAKVVDFGQIRGQQQAKEAAVVAAAGGHNLLLIGPPGEGKSLLASAMPGILPKLSNEERVELTRIYSAAGEIEEDGMVVMRRPLRTIHHSASKQSLIGGGQGLPRPGEITMAHLGILFMDELAEFSGATLESLRQPMESGSVTISRVGGSFTYPCRFTLVAAMNPCPCGYFSTDRCKCKPTDIKRYQSTLSGPILDRIDLQVELKPLTTDERFAETEGGLSPKLRLQVERARARQAERYKGMDVPFNAAMPGGRVRELCSFDDAGFARFKEHIESSTLTTRSMDRLAKVARTIADLKDSDSVLPEHVDKAAQYVVGGMLREAFA